MAKASGSIAYNAYRLVEKLPYADHEQILCLSIYRPRNNILCITVRPIIKTMYVGLSLSAEVPQSTSYACITPLGLQLVYDRTSLSALERLLKICIKLTCRRSLVHTSICSQQSICQLIDSFWLIYSFSLELIGLHIIRPMHTLEQEKSSVLNRRLLLSSILFKRQTRKQKKAL